MTKPYSIAFKQKMVERLTGKNAVSAVQLARDTGIRQQNLSRWLQEARSLPYVVSSNESGPRWGVEQKAQLVANAAKLSGEQLTAYLAEQGVKLADFERWRSALQDDSHGSTAAGKRIRQLERELARKEKALAEAAALLVLKKRVQSLYPDEDDDAGGPSGS
jgi:transposase